MTKGDQPEFAELSLTVPPADIALIRQVVEHLQDARFRTDLESLVRASGRRSPPEDYPTSEALAPY